MEDKGLIFFGTLGLLAYNLLVVLLVWLAASNLSVVLTIIFSLPFVVGAIYFDVLLIKYFIAKIKSRKQ